MEHLVKQLSKEVGELSEELKENRDALREFLIDVKLWNKAQIITISQGRLWLRPSAGVVL